MGTRNLATLDRDMHQQLSRTIQEAFANGMENDLILGTMLVGGAPQSVYEESAVQNYEIGTVRIRANGDKARYCKSGGALVACRGAKYWYKALVAYAAAAESAAAGATSVKVTVGASDGKAGNGAIALNELKGGRIVIYDATAAHRDNRGIVGNTAVSAGGGTMTITLDGPIVTPVVITTSHMEVLGNPYEGLVNQNDGYSSIVVVPLIDISGANKYFWGFEETILWLSPDSTTPDPGADGAQRKVLFDNAGDLVCRKEAGAGYDDAQIAGYIVQRDASGAAGPPFVRLQL